MATVRLDHPRGGFALRFLSVPAHGLGPESYGFSGDGKECDRNVRPVEPSVHLGDRGDFSLDINHVGEFVDGLHGDQR